MADNDPRTLTEVVAASPSWEEACALVDALLVAAAAHPGSRARLRPEEVRVERDRRVVFPEGDGPTLQAVGALVAWVLGGDEPGTPLRRQLQNARARHPRMSPRCVDVVARCVARESGYRWNDAVEALDEWRRVVLAAEAPVGLRGGGRAAVGTVVPPWVAGGGAPVRGVAEGTPRRAWVPVAGAVLALVALVLAGMVVWTMR